MYVCGWGGGVGVVNVYSIRNTITLPQVSA